MLKIGQVDRHKLVFFAPTTSFQLEQKKKKKQQQQFVLSSILS